MSNEQIKTDYPKPMSFVAMVFWTGLFGGLFWGTLGFFAYYLNFTDISPNVILEPFALGNWKNGWLGTVISILIMGIFSVPAAYIYYAVLKKFKGIWFGLGFGIVLFLLVFFVLNLFLPGIKPFFNLSPDTIITSICLYIVYGIFIGYSINYEYQNNKVEDKEAAT
ncbi:YqhR family membrane protein [Neobacillus ginsengisoli]|uniref:Phosphoglycerol transferase MdoB-like AlkP superfamily enzyme n=1 Tax=Neobacillus ginsengisoli TaxID=904295 RepID=A0ABT9XP53_9BACI|nr:YqhR family membrane protein [Neobacillus ginsengisoli]MDQ0197332.1 phosphoglycerol transferase MdoB-like AlkP superfamily enzyme [Neobacillus ginsengisoli]